MFNELNHGMEEVSDQQTEKHIDIDLFNGEEMVSNDPNTTQPVLRRSQRERHLPDYYGQWVNMVDDTMKEPTTVKEALMDKCNGERNGIASLEQCLEFSRIAKR